MASKNPAFFPTNNLKRITVVVGVILLIPLFGDIFVEGWKWEIIDFIVAAAALFGTGLLIDLATRKINNQAYRIIAVSAILLAFFTMWVEAATDGVSRTLASFF